MICCKVYGFMIIYIYTCFIVFLLSVLGCDSVAPTSVFAFMFAFASESHDNLYVPTSASCDEQRQTLLQRSGDQQDDGRKTGVNEQRAC